MELLIFIDEEDIRLECEGFYNGQQFSKENRSCLFSTYQPTPTKNNDC